MRKARQWSVAARGLIYNRSRIRRNVLQYRRQVRDQLQALIRDLERQIDNQAGVYLPLRVPSRDSAMRDYLPELYAATNHFRYFVRSWQGSSVTSRQPFWGYNQTNCGLDELLDGLGYWHEAAPDEGRPSGFDRFVGLVEQNRLLRGRGGLYGMLSNGLQDSVAQLVAPDELSRLVLTDTLDEAADALVKELAALPPLYRGWEMPEAELDERRSDYRVMVETGERNETYVLLLSDYDRGLVSLTEPITDWRALAAGKLGIVDNFDAWQPEPVLAKIIPLKRPKRVAATAAAM